MEDRVHCRKASHPIAGHNQLSSSHEKSINTGRYRQQVLCVVTPSLFHSFMLLLIFNRTIVLQDLKQLAAELRMDIVHSVSQTGGHLSSSLGVVELSVALHHVFSTPDDKIIWDVGHQVQKKKIIFWFD